MKRNVVGITLAPLLLILICCSVCVALTSIGETINQKTTATESSGQEDADRLQLQETLRQKFNLSEQQAIGLTGALLWIRGLFNLFFFPFRIIFIIVIFLVAFVIHRMAWHISGGLLHVRLWRNVLWWSSGYIGTHRFHLNVDDLALRPERQKTIQHLVASTISISVFVTATVIALGQFLSGESLAIVAGLFTAAFGFGARTLIGDLLAGISNIFEDNFDVGEKVEVAHVTGKVEGVIEALSLRTISIRAPSGELYVIPNGEVRILRNFSRGRFSMANIKLKLATSDLSRALARLQELGPDAVAALPNLLEPWQVISEAGMMGKNTELTLVAKARFGKAAELRPTLLAWVQERLAEIDVSLVD